MLLEEVSKTIQNEAKKQRGGFLRMLLGRLGSSLLGNILTGKGIDRIGKRVIRVSYGNKKGRKVTTKRQDDGFLMPPHPLTNFEIQKYYQNELKLNGVSSENKISKINDGTYIINFDGYESIGTHWISLYINDNNVI